MSHRRVLAMFGLGLILGGLTSALFIWVLSGLITPVSAMSRSIAFGIVTAVLAGRELGVLRFPLPQAARLVPRSVFSSHPAAAARQFGFEMGTGVRTYLSASAPYVLASALFLLRPGVVAALAAGVGFGVGRLLAPVLRAMSGSGRMWSSDMARSEFQIRVLSFAGALIAIAPLVIWWRP